MSLISTVTASPVHIFITSAVVASCVRLLYHILKRRVAPSPRSDIIPSPESTLLSHLTPLRISQLPYPPTALPNGRWVDTTYGRIRCYTVGPSTGRRVVFVHGISTPCVSGRDIALSLAEKGCYVLLFDLPGRGYSECPRDVNQDIDMFSSLLKQLVTAAFGVDGFPVSLIGYSLGGCICASFASRNPELVSSLVAMSSPGLMRKNVLPLPTRLCFSPWVPDKLWEILVSRQLKEAEKPPAEIPEETPTMKRRDSDGERGLSGTVHGSKEAQEKQDGDWKPVDVAGIIRWQSMHHRGYLHSFVSSFRHAPIFDADKDWKRLGGHLRSGRLGFERSDSSHEYLSNGKDAVGETGKLLAIYGADDILTPPTLLENIKTVLGDDCVDSVVVNGVGHELPVYRPKDVVAAISKSWNI